MRKKLWVAAAVSATLVVQTPLGVAAGGSSSDAPATPSDAAGVEVECTNGAAEGTTVAWMEGTGISSWAEARTAAATYAEGAYLAEIRSADLQACVAQLLALPGPAFGLNPWVGGSDGTVEGEWRWVTSGEQFWQGDTSGAAVAGRFENWSVDGDGNKAEPNDFESAEDCMVIGVEAPNRWNDNGCSNADVPYLVMFPTPGFGTSTTLPPDSTTSTTPARPSTTLPADPAVSVGAVDSGRTRGTVVPRFTG